MAGVSMRRQMTASLLVAGLVLHWLALHRYKQSRAHNVKCCTEILQCRIETSVLCLQAVGVGKLSAVTALCAMLCKRMALT